MAKKRPDPPVRPVRQAQPVRSAQVRASSAGRRGPGGPLPWLGLGAVATIAVVAVLVISSGKLPTFGGPGPGPTSIPAAGCQFPDAARPAGPPDVAPLAVPPVEPVGDGTLASIETEVGTIVIELLCGSAPVAAHNFINLAESGFYDGVVFHRIVPNFVIQGGDPEGTGGGGPGYTIPDEPVVGEYGRGIVAMARTPAPNSAGSQFFIVVDDEARAALDSAGTYVIFGEVTSGMDVADEIVAGERTGPQQDIAVDPVAMTTVTIERP